MRKGWERKTLGECFKLKSGEMLTAKMMKTEGQFPVYEGNGISGLHSEYNLSGNNVIVGRVGALCGNIRNITEKIWLTDNAFQIVDFKHKFDNSFLTYLLNFKNLRSLARQSAQPVISNSSLSTLILEFPKSLVEQQNIVSILDEAFAAIDQAKENLQRNLQNANELFQSELNDIFEKKGKEWIEKEFQEAVDTSCTLSYGIVQPGDEFPNGIPIVRPTDLTQKIIGLSGLKLIKPSVADGYKRTTLKGNELLLCVRGSTGIISKASKELNGANVTRGIVPILFDSTLLSQEFGYYLTISPYFQKQIKAKTYGAALMQINIGDLRKVLIPFPPLKEQKKIVNQLDSLSIQTEALENIYKQKLDNLEELKKSILQKAFSGELSSPERALAANDGHSPSQKKKASPIKSPERA